MLIDIAIGIFAGVILKAWWLCILAAPVLAALRVAVYLLSPNTGPYLASFGVKKNVYFYFVASTVILLVSLITYGIKHAGTKPQLTPDEENNLTNFVEALRERTQATRKLNSLLNSISGFGTISKQAGDDLVQRWQRALQFSRATRNDVLDKVHPELRDVVRNHFDKQLELSIQSFKERNPSRAAQLSLEYQKHGTAFGDWWDGHTKDMPLLARLIKEKGGLR